MKNKKGFTLIELLAVIVILGLLMAIAIPSVTKYITQSRKKTVVSTIGNYITAMVNEVNDLTYTFTGDNTIYAVPIECIALERGGTNPFGHWLHANDAYWAYVLVQYDDETSSYTYGYTFKDSAGYGLYPTAQPKLNEQGKQIQTGLSLSKPTSGKITSTTAVTNWNGFNVDGTTSLVVLEAESEGNSGDGEYTCTLQQKGDNYVENENNKKTNLSYQVKLGDYISMTPTLTTFTTDSWVTGGASITFNPSKTKVWRVIKINSDKTIEVVSDKIPFMVIDYVNMRGYTNFIGYANLLASKFENSKYTINSRAMGFNGQTEYLDYQSLEIHQSIFLEESKFICKTTTVDNSKEHLGCGDLLYKNDVDLVNNALGDLKASLEGRDNTYSDYRLASRKVIYDPNSVNILVWGSAIVSSAGEIDFGPMHNNCTATCGNSTLSASIRPILTLKANINIESGNGTSSLPYILAS